MQARGWPLETTFVTGEDSEGNVSEDDKDPRVDGPVSMLYDDHYDGDWAGPWNGTFHVDVECGENDPGSWDGTFTGKCYGGGGWFGGIAYGRGKGSDCVEGMKIRFDMENVVEFPVPDDPTVRVEHRTLRGYILDPYGE